MKGRYVASRFFLHNPPGEDNALSMERTGPAAMKKRAQKYTTLSILLDERLMGVM
jgi:hypothetical protein